MGKKVVKKILKDGRNNVGEYIMIKKIKFKIIGNMEKKGEGFGGQDKEDVVVVKIYKGNMRILGKKYVSRIKVKVKD